MQFLARPFAPKQQVAIAALTFAVIGIGLQWWRLTTLNATYDQGIFLQVLWNGLSGHPFESTLSSQLSTHVVHAGELPRLGYQRLSQHFTPILAIWIPFIGLAGIWALSIIQIGLISAAGLMLYKLASIDLNPELAAKISFAFYGANAVVGPASGNFTDLCQLPLLVFALLYALRTNRHWLALTCCVLIPLVREDTGVVLASVGLWIGIRHPSRRALGVAMVIGGLAWVAIVTNILMPHYGDDNARRFMVSNFGQFVPGSERATSLQILQQALSQPLILLRELVSPPIDTIRYLVGQGLPLLFIPLISIDAWLLTGLPLLGLLLAQGSNDPLSINIRYTFLVVPGLFAGASIWWERRQHHFGSKRLRQIWTGCILLSLLFAITANQNRGFSFLIPDSVQPWVYSNPRQQWQHGMQAREALTVIPKKASVSANTNLVPLLADRAVLVRFPNTTAFQDRQGKPQHVDWVAIDLNRQAFYAEAFSRERSALRKSLGWINKNRSVYRVQVVRDGVVVMQRNGEEHPEMEAALDQLRAELTTTSTPS